MTSPRLRPEDVQTELLLEKQPIFETPIFKQQDPGRDEELIQYSRCTTDVQVRRMLAIAVLIDGVIVMFDHGGFSGLWESLKDMAVEAAKYSDDNGLVVHQGFGWLP